MIPDFIGWYLGSLAEFWSSVLTIRIPQLLILFLIIWWVFGKQKRRRHHAFMWGCCCCSGRGCRCTCGKCCCQDGVDEDVDEDLEAEEA